MGYRHHGVTTGGIPLNYIRLFQSTYDIPVFIETGTAGGESVREAANIFPICHTIEIVEKRADGEYPENVELHTGDSGELLRSITCKYKNQDIFFWLDAHWSEPYDSAEDEEECPLMREIDSIYHSGIKQPFIMIDDARLFLGPPPWPCDPRKWPRIKDIFHRLTSCWPDHIISVVDDYIICFPNHVRDTFRDEWRGRFKERYPEEETKMIQGARNAYLAFLKLIE